MSSKLKCTRCGDVARWYAWYLGGSMYDPLCDGCLGIKRALTTNSACPMVSAKPIDPEDTSRSAWNTAHTDDNAEGSTGAPTVTHKDFGRKDQGLPIKGEAPVTPVAQSLFTTMLREAEQRGIERYKTTLETFNGRDAIKDAMEEAIDLWQYLTQIRLENDTQRRDLDNATAALHWLLNCHRDWSNAGRQGVTDSEWDEALAYAQLTYNSLMKHR